MCWFSAVYKKTLFIDEPVHPNVSAVAVKKCDVSAVPVILRTPREFQISHSSMIL